MDLILPTCTAKARKKGLTVTVRRDLSPVPPIMGDSSELREVVSNLIINAAEAMNHNGEIVIRTAPGNGSVLIEVSDTGAGMSTKVLSQVFNPFFTTKGSRGNGLGLYVSRTIIERHKGDIDVTSTEGSGTTFTIALPIDRRGVATPPEPAPVVASPIPAPAEAPRSEGRSILVVDDEDNIRHILREYLNYHGYDVTVSPDGPSALSLFDDRSFDILITDLNMPGMSGIDIARTCPHTPPSSSSPDGTRTSRASTRTRLSPTDSSTSRSIYPPWSKTSNNCLPEGFRTGRSACLSKPEVSES